MSAYIDGGPNDYLSLLALPADVAVNWLPGAKSDMEFVYLFATSFHAEKETGILPEKNCFWRSDLGLLAEEEFRCRERRYRRHDSRCRRLRKRMFAICLSHGGG
jgi:hypothetical protein